MQVIHTSPKVSFGLFVMDWELAFQVNYIYIFKVNIINRNNSNILQFIIGSHIATQFSDVFSRGDISYNFDTIAEFRQWQKRQFHSISSKCDISELMDVIFYFCRANALCYMLVYIILLL